MDGLEGPSALRDQLKKDSSLLVQAVGCTPMEARAFVLSQPAYYPRLCPIPECSLFNSIRRRRIVHLRHLLNLRYPHLPPPNDPFLLELELEVARIEFAGRMPPLVTRTHIRRELLMRGLEQRLLRKAFRSMAVVTFKGLPVRRPPSPWCTSAATLGHHTAAICSLVLLLITLGRTVATDCFSCSALGLLITSFFLAWVSYCLFLFGPDWINSDRLLVRLGF